MAELKIYLPNDLDTRFRKAAMIAFGYGRGSLSKAAVEALATWCSEREDVKYSKAATVQKNTPQPGAGTAETVEGSLPENGGPGGSTRPTA